mmetsp:Transcript_148721/g.386684  ORF Transcript_148721/g.386684 Transcript_148721/m.386684 type:complete len:255 (-) Transcript_148721:187-951(-)
MEGRPRRQPAEKPHHSAVLYHFGECCGHRRYSDLPRRCRVCLRHHSALDQIERVVDRRTHQACQHEAERTEEHPRVFGVLVALRGQPLSQPAVVEEQLAIKKCCPADQRCCGVELESPRARQSTMGHGAEHPLFDSALFQPRLLERHHRLNLLQWSRCQATDRSNAGTRHCGPPVLRDTLQAPEVVEKTVASEHERAHEEGVRTDARVAAEDAHPVVRNESWSGSKVAVLRMSSLDLSLQHVHGVSCKGCGSSQ